MALVIIASVLLLLLVQLFVRADSYSCNYTKLPGTTSNGQSVADPGKSTGFGLLQYKGFIAIDSTYCQRACCEDTTCGAAVFDYVEAICYLKLKGAEGPYIQNSRFVAYNNFVRSGSPSPLATTPTKCNNKKGLAYGFTTSGDLKAFSNALSWWYDWSPGNMAAAAKDTTISEHLEYAPMMWSPTTLSLTSQWKYLQELKSGNVMKYLLWFNEPNMREQSSVTAVTAASYYIQMQAIADRYGLKMVAPAMTYCGVNCIEPNPIKWLKDFFAACKGCTFSALAVHSYACEVRYLNKHIYSYTQFGLPIWLTEFACGDQASKMNAAYQYTYMTNALKYLELNAHVIRYAWFSGRTTIVGGASLMTSTTGQLNTLGYQYVGLYGTLSSCGSAQPAPAPAPSPGSCANGFLKQCGGKLFKGSTCCQPGFICTFNNDYWSDCQSTSSSTCKNGVRSQCGGLIFKGLTCCPSGTTCTFKNTNWWDCQPMS